jgi:hypothetical protein
MNTVSQADKPVASPVTRFVIWITRGEVPVDGCEEAKKGDDAPAPPTAPPTPYQPVRWGNFR